MHTSILGLVQAFHIAQNLGSAHALGLSHVFFKSNNKLSLPDIFNAKLSFRKSKNKENEISFQSLNGKLRWTGVHA